MDIPNEHSDYVYRLDNREGIPRYVLKRAKDSASRLGNEIAILSTLPPHPNVIAFVAAAPGALLVEAHGADLYVLVYERGGHECSLVRRWLRDAASALVHLHSLGYIHRDVKLENLVVAADGRVVLIDFEYCCRSPTASEIIGTAGYIAPEMNGVTPYTSAVDVFALGVCAFSLLHPEHKDPWRSHEKPILHRSRLAAFTDRPKDRYLLIHSLQQDPLYRMTAARFLERV